MVGKSRDSGKMRREVVMVVRFCMTVFLRSEYGAVRRLGEGQLV
jgi:hypothetical protein